MKPGPDFEWRIEKSRLARQVVMAIVLAILVVALAAGIREPRLSSANPTGTAAPKTSIQNGVFSCFGPIRGAMTGSRELSQIELSQSSGFDSIAFSFVPGPNQPLAKPTYEIIPQPSAVFAREGIAPATLEGSAGLAVVLRDMSANAAPVTVFWTKADELEPGATPEATPRPGELRLDFAVIRQLASLGGSNGASTWALGLSASPCVRVHPSPFLLIVDVSSQH